MKVTYSPMGDVMYIRLNKRSFQKTRIVNDGFLLDLDEDGEVIGIEIISASALLADSPDQIQFELLNDPPIESKDLDTELKRRRGEHE
jgi:uncharacterized protein YuzE